MSDIYYRVLMAVFYLMAFILLVSLLLSPAYISYIENRACGEPYHASPRFYANYEGLEYGYMQCCYRQYVDHVEVEPQCRVVKR